MVRAIAVWFSSLPLALMLGGWSGAARAESAVPEYQLKAAFVFNFAVFAEWPTVVGDQIAEHAAPTALRDGVLHVVAESTAWATQLRMVQAQLLAKIAAAVGDGVVTTLKITGPVAPSWRKGPLHVRGRGPRDTYG